MLNIRVEHGLEVRKSGDRLDSSPSTGISFLVTTTDQLPPNGSRCLRLEELCVGNSQVP